MGLDISIGGAFLAGLLSFLPPCVLPLVPPYLCFLAGVSLDDLTSEEGGTGTVSVFPAAVAFVLGFATVFIALGATASTIGQMVSDHLDLLSKIAGAVIIVMGLHFLGVFRIGLLYREARVTVASKPAGLAGSYLIGLAFAFGWTPCVGPALAAILMVAGAEESVSEGAGLLAVYAAGLGVPFLLAAAFVKPFMNWMRGFGRYLGYVEKTMGAFLVATGVMFITGSVATISYWLLETFPVLGTIG